MANAKKQAVNRRKNGQFDKDNDEGRKFAKGTSGNPHGRPKTLKELRALIQEIANEPHPRRRKLNKLQAMLDKMMDSRSPADRKEVLRYGWGEPPQEVRNLNIDWDSLSDEQVERIARGEDVVAVLATASTGRTRAPETPEGESAARP